MKIFFILIICFSCLSCVIDKSPLDVTVDNIIILKSDKNEYESFSIAKFTIINHSDKSVLLSTCGTHFIYLIENYENDIWVENIRRQACRDSLKYYELLADHENHFAQNIFITPGKTRLKVFYYDSLEYGSKNILYSNIFIVN